MPRVDDYKAALALVVAELQELNPKRLAGRSRGEFFFEHGIEGLIVPYFGQGRRVLWPGISVTAAAGAGEIPLTEQILILHYLRHSSGEPLSGRDIDFRQVPEGSFYWSAFVSRAKKPLLQTFGSDLELYLKVASQMGGEPQPLGDAAARFLAFPLVPVTHVLWRGDAEFPPEGNVLFDSSITEYLPVEDIVILTETIIWKLVRKKGLPM